MGHGLNENGLFFKHHCTTKVKKTHPHSNLDWRKERLVKIVDTIQEEEFQVGESSWATMAIPINDEIAQKIFKAIEEQSDVLKKRGSCLTKLDKAKLKKPNLHVEVFDDEEVEDWGEMYKVD